MLDQRHVGAQPDERREQLFTERYESLLAWALRLTNQQRDAAEDLVQDAFVEFVLGRTRLEEIENIDGYLRRMLRYMHVSRLSRSAQHLHETALSVADYDSGRFGWTAIEPPRRMQASEELHQICTYACTRKESSRAGSVFILRFFHEYRPTEIAAILNSTRHCVDQWQGLARREAKLFLNEPRRLSFVNARKLLDQRQTKYLKSDCDLMPELRQMIFDSRRGECLPAIELDEIYTQANPDALTTAKLAHIVSCSSCLDAVNSLLGLPLLAQRVIGASRLLKATLTINKSDLYPVEQTLLVQRGGESGKGGELREYRFVEASSAQMPSQEVAPSIFEVEPELTGGTAEIGKTGDWALRNSTTSLIPPAPSASTPPVASAELEVDVTYLLNQAKADRNEQVTLTRSAGGSLRVEGIVETEQRKQEFLSALAPVANNPAVTIEIHTVADALPRSTTPSRTA
jgi:RNA polymerase sigma factor (sigma-70 family)